MQCKEEATQLQALKISISLFGFPIFFTAITNPKVPPGTADSVKRFNFDYSYWSHDVSEKLCQR